MLLLPMAAPPLARCTAKPSGIALLWISLAFLLPLLSLAADTIKLGESLRDGETLVSANQIFALGFFSPGGGSDRYVAVWYQAFSPNTSIWVANRQRPVKGSSGSLAIATDGNLVVLDGGGAVVWSSNATAAAAASNDSVLQLTDSGNLVLNRSGGLAWQSFDNPGDTYMPGMKVGLDLRSKVNQYMTSWTSADDPAPGNFSLSMDPRESTEIFMWQGSKPRWRSGRWNGQVFLGIPNMTAQYLYGFKLNNFLQDQKMYFYFEEFNGFHRYVLTWDGLIKHMVWKNGTSQWLEILKEPATACELYNQCGKNAGCTDGEAGPSCSCLKGFVPASDQEWNNGNWTRGCVRRTPLACNGGGDGFDRLQGVKLPDVSDWYDRVSTADACREKCLMNCSCTAYASDTGIICLMWGVDLLDIHMFSSGGSDLYVRLAASELADNHNTNWTLIIIIIVVVSVCCLGFLLLLWICRKSIKDVFRGSRNEVTKMSVDYRTAGGTSSSAVRLNVVDDNEELSELQLWNFDVVLRATKNFAESELIGKGGFGPVYMGVLPEEQQEIAVKRLSRSSGQGVEEFMNEVKLISQLQHRNLVKLLGCCIHGEEKILIYEYMPNKSLDAFLYDPTRKHLLNWRTRYSIIEGIARGLLYLHRDSRLRIIHRDLKAGNVLLDEKMNPKISDFGMARIFGNDNESNTNRVVGTFGYMAPEYAMQGIFSTKSDVYSFGILVFEILSGKRNNAYHHAEVGNLVASAWRLLEEKKVMEFLDPILLKSCIESEVELLVNLGILCVQDHPEDRPSMASVVVMLDNETAGGVALPIKKPTFTTQTALSVESETSTLDYNVISTNASITAR